MADFGHVLLEFSQVPVMMTSSADLIDSLFSVYKGLVQPYFEYCTHLWDTCGRFRSRAARVLTGASYDD